MPPVLPARSDDLSWRINPNVIYNNLEDYAKLYVKLGLRHPIEYVDAFLANNSPAEAAAPTDFLSKGLLRTVLFL